MDEDAVPARLAELPEGTRQFLSELSPEDLKTFRAALPIIRAILGFGKVTKWLAIAALGILGGIVMIGDSVVRIIGWVRSGFAP